LLGGLVDEPLGDSVPLAPGDGVLDEPELGFEGDGDAGCFDPQPAMANTAMTNTSPMRLTGPVQRITGPAASLMADTSSAVSSPPAGPTQSSSDRSDQGIRSADRRSPDRAPLSGLRRPGGYGGLVSVYVIVQLNIHDRASYDRYAAAFPATMEQYGGTVLAADDSPRVLEGEWTGDRVVLLTFPDRQAFTSWATSAEYQAIVGDRRAGSTAVITLVRGLA
jgi:uncharacterized protein (DUF1330 family)